ncbi:GNAT family N-acetyltransferase [Ruminococcaceae bacterium OttesenSCG-928-O06]|nr:GNAT family N-acetyltransferase [Ruminococcaceae bacterium OttesenSCG-928-O06]
MVVIRDFTAEDKEAVLAMVDAFYHSPAVDHDIPLAHFADVYDEMCGGGSARVRGLAVQQDGKLVGFCALSFSYSTEAGGPVVLIEEAAILPECRGAGLGQALFAFIQNEYRGKAARLRLEVAPDNTRAMALYERMGFARLPYIQMISEAF